MLTIRLEEELEREIEKISKSEGISKSEFIRRTIREYLRNRKEPDMYEVGKEMFNKYSFADKNLSVNTEKILKDHFRKKHG
jgi:metal-responsive CopG/Arc/MetJ family transcriptional regulator